jgi:hypothetical protein
MDRQAEARRRYERLKDTLSDDKRIRRKGRRARLIGLGIVGAWAVVPTAAWRVDLDSAARPEFFRRPTPHEEYLLELAASRGDSPSEVNGWETAAYRAIDEPVPIGAAYREEALFPSDVPGALGLRVHIPQGQRLRLTVEGDEEDPEFFVDLFRAAPEAFWRPASNSGAENGAASGGSAASAPLIHGDGANSFVEPRPAFVLGEELEDGRWHFDAEEAGDFVLRLQPKLDEGGQIRASIQVGAPWHFPVAEAGEDDIGGVFGDPRDGGRREHHGVDIFKPRGTPVLAAADGRVTSVDTTEVGGRVVWQREAGGRHSLYYAHLETPLVRDGQQLRAGDTVGLVGNTGNARSTPPHLHFGAYRRGPVDPWDLILPAPPEIPVIDVDLSVLGGEATVTEAGVRLRRSPSLNGDILAELPADTAFRILAGAGEWYRVALADGRSGYINARAVAIPAPNGTDRAGQP